MKMTIYYESMETKEFFFTKNHCQQVIKGQNIPKHFVAVSNYKQSQDQIRGMQKLSGVIEIPNPDPYFDPDTTLYYVEGNSFDGFPIEEHNLTRSEALHLCKEAGMNYLVCMHNETM
jgi:hypothetical protein